jgi:hypothetical protein
MSLIDGARIRDAANTDPEFAIAARFWTGDVRFDVGSQAHALRMKDGRVVAFEALTAPPDGAPWDLWVSAPPEAWEQMLQPLPRPFWHDFMAAASRQGVALAGDPARFGPYYPALRRLLEIMRTLPRED